MRSAPLNVLIVDDDPALAGAARGLLARRGCRLDAVFSGIDAVARVRAGGIDAVLLDVWMPEVNGLSVLDEILQLQLPHPPRVVLMSGNIDAKVEEAVVAGKAVACLAKPIDFELAYTLLAGEAPERPLQLKPELEGAALASFASSALSRGQVFLENAPGLPTETPVAIAIPTPAGDLSLLGVADPAARHAGRRGLGVRLAELTTAQQRSLRVFAGAPPTSSATPLPAPPPPVSRAQELYRRGLERLETDRYDKALLDLRAARELDPSDPLIAAAMLRAEELAGVEKARSLYRRSQEQRERDPQEALRLLEDAIRLDPNRAIYHREAARLYLQSGDALQQAEERLAAAIHLAPSDPAPRLHLAQLLERAGRVQEALWACEAAMVLFPGDPELQKLAAKLKRRQGNKS